MRRRPAFTGRFASQQIGPKIAVAAVVQGNGKRFVYILRSDVYPDRHYVGVTRDVENRLHWHNHGPCGHTTEHRPWSLVVAIEFQTEQHAVRFERYLKSGSGRAFAARHFGS